VVIVGMGGSAMAGDVARGLTMGSTIPVHVARGYTLPAWVGEDDAVIAVSCSGGTEETVSVAQQAEERGIKWAAVSSPDSALAELASRDHVLHLAVDDGGRAPRASLWTLAVPLLGLLDALGVTAPIDQLPRIADRLDDESAHLMDAATEHNVAKRWAHELVDDLPMVWGTTELGGVAAFRAMAQLAENASMPSVHAQLPEANHNQVVVLDGTTSDRPVVRLHLLRDPDEHPQVTKRATVSAELAAERGIPVTQAWVEGDTSFERFAALVQRIDLASVYAAYLRGIDPSAIVPITALKERIAR
jgi:glucose/mannose-6-phosphate isomerase